MLSRKQLIGALKRLGVLAIPVLGITTGSAAAISGPIGYTGGMMDSGWGFFGGWMFLWPLLFLAIILYAVYQVGEQGGGEGGGGRTDDALDELRRRYARGELSDEEFDRRKRKLQSER